jgi:hypothetical protein
LLSRNPRSVGSYSALASGIAAYSAEALIDVLNAKPVALDMRETARLVSFLKHGAQWDDVQAGELFLHADRIAAHLNKLLADGVEIEVSALGVLFSGASSGLDESAFAFSGAYTTLYQRSMQMCCMGVPRCCL